MTTPIFKETNQFLGAVFFKQLIVKIFILVCKTVYHQYVYAILCLLLFPEEGLNTENLENKVKVKIFSVENHFSKQVNI